MRRRGSCNINAALNARKCAVCGKNICRVNWEDYVYKRGGKYFCSYSCMRKEYQ